MIPSHSALNLHQATFIHPGLPLQSPMQAGHPVEQICASQGPALRHSNQ